MAEKLRRIVLVVLAVAALYGLEAAIMAGLVRLDLVPGDITLHWQDVLRLSAYTGFLLIVTTGVLPAVVLHKMHVRSISAYLLNGFASALTASYCFLFSIALSRPDIAGWIFSMPPFSWTPDSIHELLQPFLFEKEAVLADLIGLISGAVFWVAVVRRAKRASAQ
jgi:hypothetical protein